MSRGLGVFRGRQQKEDSLKQRIEGELARSEASGVNPYDGSIAPLPAPETRDTSDNSFENAPKMPQNKGNLEHGIQSVDYTGGIDDIIAASFEKQKAAFEVAKAVSRCFESRGIEIPFDDERFVRVCNNLAVVQASREIAWLFGLGAEHAEKIAEHMIDRLFGPIKERK